MSHSFLRYCALFAAMLVAIPPQLQAEGHLVPLTDLHRKAMDSAKDRAERLGKIDRMLELAPAKKAIQAAGISSSAVKAAAAQLSDDELARLSARAESVTNDFAAGAMSNQQLTYVVVALATAVLIIVLVAA